VTTAIIATKITTAVVDNVGAITSWKNPETMKVITEIINPRNNTV
jgi:hypothetical protein